MQTAIRLVCSGCGMANRIAAAHLAGVPRHGSCHDPLFTAHPIDVDEAAFERHRRRGDIPVLVDIRAWWRGPCRTMAPAFDCAALALEPGVRLLKLNADQTRSTCARLDVRGIPALFLFDNGTVAGRTTGATDTNAIVRWARGQITSNAHCPSYAN